MRTRRNAVVAAFVLALSVGAAAASHAGPESGVFTPSVPVSAFARPASWLDPSRLQMSTEFSVGTGLGGSQGMQVTRLSYRLGAPLSMSVSVGNAFGGKMAGGSGMFLEGLDLSYRPLPSMLVQFRYNDIRSPLQLRRYYDYWR